MQPLTFNVGFPSVNSTLVQGGNRAANTNFGGARTNSQPAFAQSFQPFGAFQLIFQMMQIMQQMMQYMFRQQQPQQPQQPPNGQPPAGQPPIGQPPVQPPVGQPPAKPPVGQPPTQPPVGQPPAQPPVGQPPANPPAQPPNGQPPANPPAQPPANDGTLATPDINRNIDFTKLNKEQRTELGLADRDRAILHLWGRQVISRGFNDGGIYTNVLDKDPQMFTQAERDLITEMRARDQAKFGADTGKALDEEFFGLMQRMHPGAQIDTNRWLNSPVRQSAGAVDIQNDLSTLQKNTGLNEIEQAALRLWGHEPLMNGGRIDGSILAYTVGNNNALDNKKGAGAKVDNYAQTLLEADFASDGVRNGDSLAFAFGRVLDKVYLGGPDLTENMITQRAEQTAQANGRTPVQVAQDVKQGVTQAMADVAKTVKDHPVVSTMAIGGMAAATAVCPFLGGLAIGGAGIAAGQSLLNKQGETQAAAAA